METTKPTGSRFSQLFFIVKLVKNADFSQTDMNQTIERCRSSLGSVLSGSCSALAERDKFEDAGNILTHQTQQLHHLVRVCGFVLQIRFDCICFPHFTL